MKVPRTSTRKHLRIILTDDDAKVVVGKDDTLSAPRLKHLKAAVLSRFGETLEPVDVG